MASKQMAPAYSTLPNKFCHTGEIIKNIFNHEIKKSCEMDDNQKKATELDKTITRNIPNCSEEILSKSDTLSLRQKHIGFSCKLFFHQEPLKIVYAKNQFMYNEKNEKFLDCINNVAHVGHSHPEVCAAAASQMSILNTNSRFLHDNLVLLARKLTSTLPDELSVCYFVNSGSEANDLALRIARSFNQRTQMIVLDHAYHGHTIATMALSPYKFNGKGGQGKPDWIHVAACPDTYRGIYNHDTHRNADFGNLYAAEVKKIVEENHTGICGFICESLLSCAGQIILPKGYLHQVYKAVRSVGGVCIADEVQVGFGRVSSHWWAFQRQGVVPDIVTVGKPFGNGHPLAAVIVTEKMAKSFGMTGMEYFNTYGGNPVSCAVGLKVMQVLEEECLRQRAGEVGNYLQIKAMELMEEFEIVGDVRGVGLFFGIELVADRRSKTPATVVAQHVITRLKSMQILLSADGPHANVLKFKPPMCFNKDDVDCAMDALKQVFQEVSPKVTKSNKRPKLSA